jgi:hypothetical protein
MADSVVKKTKSPGMIRRTINSLLKRDGDFVEDVSLGTGGLLFGYALTKLFGGKGKQGPNFKSNFDEILLFDFVAWLKSLLHTEATQLAEYIETLHRVAKASGQGEHFREFLFGHFKDTEAANKEMAGFVASTRALHTPQERWVFCETNPSLLIARCIALAEQIRAIEQAKQISREEAAQLVFQSLIRSGYFEKTWKDKAKDGWGKLNGWFGHLGGDGKKARVKARALDIQTTREKRIHRWRMLKVFGVLFVAWAALAYLQKFEPQKTEGSSQPSAESSTDSGQTSKE